MRIIKKYFYLIIALVLIITISYFVYVKIKLQNNKVVEEDVVLIKEEINEKEELKDDIIKTIKVDIKGAVNKPGVYEVPDNYIVNDIIKEAGGLTKNADTSLINLSKRVTNEMVIIIYTKEQVKKSNIVDTVVKVVEKECVCPNIQNDGCLNTEINDTITNTGNTLININEATEEELLTIPGIGSSKAKAIIEYRKQHRFNTIEDILNVSGIGNALYESIKAYITT